MQKIISVIVSVLLVGQISYIHTLCAASANPATQSKTKKIAAKKKDTAQSGKNVESAQKANNLGPIQSVTVTPATVNNPNLAAVTPPENRTPVDCSYQLSPTVAISEEELTAWAQLAVIKSFDYRFDTLETQLKKLKACYTEAGWLGFNDALKQSGNLAAIKAQQLTVSCEIEGKSKINPFKNNQWKISVPLKVVYQNTQEKLTQRLVVEIVVAKKSPTQLGIVQLIAEPKSTSTTKDAAS